MIKDHEIQLEVGIVEVTVDAFFMDYSIGFENVFLFTWVVLSAHRLLYAHVCSMMFSSFHEQPYTGYPA